MNEKKKKFLVVNDIARELNKSPITIISWVRWTEEEGKNHPKLKLPAAMKFWGKRGKKILKRKEQKRKALIS